MCEIMEELYNEGVKVGRKKVMCEIMEKLYNEGMERGIETGMKRGMNKMICCFLMNGGTEEAAMKMLNVTKEDIEAAKEMAGC